MNMSRTNAILRRLAELKRWTVAVMRGPTFVGDGAAVQNLAKFIQKSIGERN
jgi:acetyl-CoA carboxylase beta subunit